MRLTSYTDMNDTYLNNQWQQVTEYKRSDIAFSPSLTANGIIVYQAGRLNAELSSRYVSRQYLDGTQTKSRSLAPWIVNDLRLSYSLDQLTLFDGITATLMVNNLFNRLYESNGYTYEIGRAHV